MKLKHSLLILLSCLFLTACGKMEAKPHYSNLSEEETQAQIAAILEECGIAAERRKAFFSHVEEFNALLQEEEKTQGWEPLGEAKYDSDDLQLRWEEAHPDFLGCNCRITAFTLFGDFLEVAESAPILEDAILFDQSALEEDPLSFPGEREKFSQFYSVIPTDGGKDGATHLENIQKVWAERGISFVEDPKVRLISLFFHDMTDESAPKLFIGHTGLLFPREDGSLLFLEKLSFQQPYQVIKFHSREELSDYLMRKYDLDTSETIARPLILENDKLMESYRVLP